jgi:hypothetical protein
MREFPWWLGTVVFVGFDTGTFKVPLMASLGAKIPHGGLAWKYMI